MAGRIPKNTIEDWIDAGRRMLVDEGISGLKVDRLAARLGVTRGGFYYYFKDRDEFFDHLIRHWEATCRFLPEARPPAGPAEAMAWFDHTIARLIESDGYDPRFDQAVREWGRADKRAFWAVERDRDRIAILETFFAAVGYDEDQAAIRARVFYYHQIGYYAIGVPESVSDRRKKAQIYIDILSGEQALRNARAAGPAKAGRTRALR